MAQAQMTAAPLPGQSKGRFGTFGGVFTPNVLTILGIILFLRSGWVVGQAGLTNALIIVAIANSISLLTGLSLAAIATNMNVRAGGNYYIISRTLGLEIGGAIGIPSTSPRPPPSPFTSSALPKPCKPWPTSRPLIPA